ncbi:hypothetical protein [uncultured Martelella sp.]|uniref:hypothetical protein n=1 Tax=uncultured Martelella sp. TaxID=392331 RepID=UPI0029C8459F|nr:hypothetical protein [uncultured Martelella sp.]
MATSRHTIMDTHLLLRNREEVLGVLKALIRTFPDDEMVEDGVAPSIRNTGIVRGKFGFVDAKTSPYRDAITQFPD